MHRAGVASRFAGRRVRILLAGATGVIGRALLPMLLEQGHEVVAVCRSPDKLDGLRGQGAEAVALDALDPAAVREAVSAARPQAVIHQLTAIPAQINPRTVARDFVLNDRLRSEGTANLVAAAKAAGAERFIAQSIAFAYAPGPPGTVHAERDELLSPEQAPKEFRRSAGAVADLEREVLGGGGVVLRYGYFYGPGSAIARDGSMAAGLAHRRLPVVGSGSGVWSFIHVTDAASATVAALDLQGPAVLNVVDDEPAPRRRVDPGAQRGARRAPAAARPDLAGAARGRRLWHGRDDARAGCQQRGRPRRAGLEPALPLVAGGLSQRAVAAPPGALLAHDEHHARHQQQQADHAVGADLLLGDPEQPEAVDRDRHRQLPGDHHRGQAGGSQRAHHHQRHRHVDRSQQPSDQRPPRRPPDPAERAQAAADDRGDQHQRGGTDEEREARRRERADHLAQTRVDRRLDPHQAPGRDPHRHGQAAAHFASSQVAP